MKRTIVFVLATFILAGCTVGPDYAFPKSSFSDKWFAKENAGRAEQEEVKTEWWTVFGDPQLEKYIHQAAANNKNLEAARADVLRARALRREAKSSFFPDISAEGSRTRQGTSGTTSNTFSGGARRTVYDSSIDASWELDFFGGTRRETEAAQARLESAQEQERAVLLVVLAEVARNYYEVRGIQKRISIIKNNISLQEQTYKLIDTLFQLGETSEFDLSRARGQLQLTQSRLPDLDAEMRAGIFRLSVLLGQPPEALLDEMSASKPLPAPPDVVPTGLRSDILRRRPDIRVAERNLAASTADIGAETANLFPRFFLTGSAGRSSSVFSDLFISESNIFSIGQMLQWPVFEGGAIRARIKAQKAEAQQAAALYEQAVLEALSDTETALTRYAKKIKTSTLLQDAVKSRQHSVSLARMLFESGEEDFLSVLDAERELSSAEDELVLNETAAVLNLVTLYTALGGGWEVFEKPREMTKD